MIKWKKGFFFFLEVNFSVIQSLQSLSFAPQKLLLTPLVF